METALRTGLSAGFSSGKAMGRLANQSAGAKKKMTLIAKNILLVVGIPLREHAGHGNLEKKTTREQPGKTPGTPREPPGTPREQKNEFCQLVDSRC